MHHGHVPVNPGGRLRERFWQRWGLATRYVPKCHQGHLELHGCHLKCHSGGREPEPVPLLWGAAGLGCRGEDDRCGVWFVAAAPSPGDPGTGPCVRPGMLQSRGRAVMLLLAELVTDPHRVWGETRDLLDLLPDIEGRDFRETKAQDLRWGGNPSLYLAHGKVSPCLTGNVVT